MDKKDGSRVRRQYALIGQSIRFAGEQACERPGSPVSVQVPAPLPVGGAPAPVPKEGFFERLKKRFKSK